jgi:hypothetical protein
VIAMNLALAILCLWLGSALLWVASHGLPAGAGGFSDVWREVLSGISGGGQ